MKLIKSLFNVSDIEDITLDGIIKKLKSQEMLEAVQAVRNAKNKTEQDSLKLALPLFTLCNVTDRVDSDHFIDTEYLIYDVDNLPNYNTAHAYMQRVKDFALFAFISPRGKGFKFVIKMDQPIPKIHYRQNYKHYYEVLSADTNMLLDPAYHSLHTFFSHTAGVELNPNPRIFPALLAEDISAKNDVNVNTINPSEIRDVCEYLSHQSLNYMEWTQCAFALQKVKDGIDLFRLIQSGDHTHEHKHRISPEEKFKSCSDPKDITVASLFWIAHNKGYIRKHEYVAEGRGCHNPFVVQQDGMYYQRKEKRAERVFGFQSIAYTCAIHDIGGNRITLKIDNREITVKATALSSASEFRKAIQSVYPSAPFMLTNSKAGAYYDMLFDYLDQTKSKLTVMSLPGAGNVGKGIWNFGTIVYAQGKVLPFDPLLVLGEQGYILDDIRDSVSVMDSRRLRYKLKLLHTTYKEIAATAIGWAVSNVYFQKILQECGGFPIMFLYGQSSSGKSKLANIILSMFGVRSPETSFYRVSLASGSTATAMSRVKDGSAGIPQFFDEYGTARDGKTRDTHFQLLKGLFDGVGKTMARKTNDNQVHRMEIASGTMFASVDKENREEAVNRCIYVDMNGVKDTSPQAIGEFQREFMSPTGLQELSAFALHIVYETSWEQWWAAYNKYLTYLGERAIGVDSRVIINWAIVAAGYDIVKKAISKSVVVSDDWWALLAQDTSTFVEESDVVNIFLSYIYKFAISRRFPSFIKMREGTDGTTLLFCLKPALSEVRKEDRMIDGVVHLSAAEMGKRLKAKGAYTESVRFGSDDGNGSTSLWAYAIKYNDERGIDNDEVSF
ncbi:MAG TPA: BT4734/BF3469 family protein [Candidatus Cloacimonadota bacterium]|nr:BT4734/BF3469 family protein [Candidatus Cloacimonadota bacterium]HPS38369.1 BT4734/BF3469 family protein [Candidatus Cloacimonadota bacterium]